VTGTVRDPSQVVVPGAQVTVAETETNLTRKGKTSDVGVYYFGALPRGPYKITVEKQGFKTWEGTFLLEVGQSAVVDAVLQVGDLKTVVEVTGAAPLLSTQSEAVAGIRTYTDISMLPLNGRTVSLLFSLTPGVEGGGAPRINGLKVGSAEISLDGISEVDRFGGGFVRVQPGLETIQEFRIETSGSDARFDRPATVTLATRSGTNQIHGTAYEYNRNNTGGLLARRREDLPGTKPPKLIRNEFGANSGGPFYIPHLYDGRNKSFWFVDYEGLRASESSDLPFQPWVPTAAMWNGDLSNAVDTEGNAITIYDPLTTDANGMRQPFPGNIIPPERISNMAKVLQSLTALPTSNDNPYLAPNFAKFYPVITRQNSLTLKGDQNLSDRDRLSVRLTRSWFYHLYEGGYYANPINPSSGMGTSSRNYNLYNVSANYTRSISNNWLNELVVGVERSYAHYGTAADFTNWADKLGVPNPFSVTGWPTMYSCSAEGCFSYFSWDSDNNHVQALTAEVVEDNMSWTRGKHTVHFGFKGRREQNYVEELQQSQGSHEWDAAYTSLWSPSDQAPVATSGDGFAELLLGLPDYLSNQYNRGFFYFHQTELGAYATDTWKVSPRLTLTLGLRWDKWTPYTESRNRLDVADIRQNPIPFQVITPGSHSMESIPGVPPAVLGSWAQRGLTWTTANAAGYPSALFAPDNTNFGPRLGAAFQLNNKTVIRGAYGKYFWPMPLSQILQSTRNNPPLNLRFQNDPYSKASPPGFPDFSYPYVAVPAPEDYLPNATVPITGIQGISTRAQSATIWDGPNWTDSRAQNWNVTVERDLGFKTVMRLSYIGTHGSDMEQQFAVNAPEARVNYVNRTGLIPPTNSDLLRPDQNWTFIALNHTGFSSTHSGQIELQRKFSNGLGFQWFYTYTRALTTTDAGGTSDGNVSINQGGGGGQVPANTQILGEPNLSYAQRQNLVYFNSTNLPPHRITFNGVYDLPFGRGHRLGGNVPSALNQIIGGWQVSTIGTWNSGFYMSLSSTLFQNGNPRLPANKRVTMDIFGDHQRLWFLGSFDPTQATNVKGGDLPALIPANFAQRVAHPSGPNCSGKYVGQIAMTLADGTCYNAATSDFYNWSPRANIIGPGGWNDDLSVVKNFKIRERLNIRFTADFFNAFNHPNDIGPNATTGLQDLGYQVNDPRIIQLSLRLAW
jgi:hypothetical protein